MGDEPKCCEGCCWMLESTLVFEWRPTCALCDRPIPEEDLDRRQPWCPLRAVVA